MELVAMNTLPPLQIAKPCPKQWDEMTGDAKRRFCGHCQLHVHNLSAMSSAERERFVAASDSRACIAFEVRPDGSMVEPIPWPRWFQPFHRYRSAAVALLATIVPFFLASCATRRTLGRTALPQDPGMQKACDGPKFRMMLGAPLPPAENR